MRKPRYFVLNLGDEREPLPVPDKSFEIQILDGKGRAKYCGYVGEHDDSLIVEGKNIPKAVLDAARRQKKGKGDYVDDSGASIRPF